LPSIKSSINLAYESPENLSYKNSNRELIENKNILNSEKNERVIICNTEEEKHKKENKNYSKMNKRAIKQ